jgi:DNA-directed RNA polymerase subunit RPC12/RpoP
VAKENDSEKPLSARARAFDSCPHCGTALSPWEKVLLSVDRALMCKHCWYRIILDVFDEQAQHGREGKPKTKGQ